MSHDHAEAELEQSFPGETTDVKDEHPEVVTRMQKLAGELRKELGDSQTKGGGVREASPL